MEIFTMKISDKLVAFINKLVDKVNRYLRNIERAGLQDESAAYRNIEKYAIKEGSNYYNVNLDNGTIRTTKNLSRFDTPEDVYRYKETLQSIVDNETITVRGTRRAIKKGYETFMNSPTHEARPDMTYDEYRNIFKIWRAQVEPDKKNHFGSDVVLDLIENTDLYTLSDSQISEAFNYAATQGVDALLDNMFTEVDEELVFNV